MRQPVTIEARISDTGEVTVRSFTWQGRDLAVTSTGRQWTEPSDAGLRRCVLVMAAGHVVFELCLEPADLIWRARPLSPESHIA